MNEVTRRDHRNRARDTQCQAHESWLTVTEEQRSNGEMNKQESRKKFVFTAIVLICVAIGGGGIWLFQSWKATRQAALDAAYRDFLPESLANITNRYHQKQVVFTDSVERFRFDGADEKLLEELVKRYELKPSSEPLESHFNAPNWWVLPEGGACYLRGEGHQYFMLWTATEEDEASANADTNANLAFPCMIFRCSSAYCDSR